MQDTFTDDSSMRKQAMKESWSKPQVVEQEAGLEVTSYASAEVKES
jgi:coenzyme PQQ precursor peptide PqqA